MRTPLKPLPETVARWIRAARWLRWLDAVAAWVALWIGIALAYQDAGGAFQATLAALLATAGGFVSPLRARWRPASGTVAVIVSRPLRPGDRAWRVSGGGAELVLVTARKGLRVVIARREKGPVEGSAVRRTTVLLLPADSVKRKH